MHKKVFIVFLSLILFFELGYLVIFGRALKQQENHIAIACALPRIVLTSHIVKIDDETYLTKTFNSFSFINEMKQQGFNYVEQLGAGYIFEKNDMKYVSTSRMYSSYFRIFTQPKKI